MRAPNVTSLTRSKSNAVGLTMNKPQPETFNIRCLYCINTFDYLLAKFAIEIPYKKTYLLMALCPDCTIKFKGPNTANKNRMISKCQSKLLAEHNAPTHDDWAFTHDIAVSRHFGDVQAAIRYGDGLTREIRNGIAEGRVEAVFLPGGFIVTSSVEGADDE